jgi:hypothetical protein
VHFLNSFSIVSTAVILQVIFANMELWSFEQEQLADAPIMATSPMVVDSGMMTCTSLLLLP